MMNAILLVLVLFSTGLKADIYISEYSDAGGTGNYIYEFLELYNNSDVPERVDDFVLRQANSTQSFTLPNPTTIPANGFLIVGRNADQGVFETFWSVSFGESVAYINSGNKCPQINGDEVYLFENTADTNIDPSTDDEYTTQSISSGGRVYRSSTGNLAGDWSTGSDDNATPGSLDNDQSLPVELSAWSATSTMGYVALTWTTESEIENQGFIVNRRLEGHTAMNEISSFTDNSQLIGQGSSTARNTYTYTDKQVEVGQTYIYQLSDVDYRGTLTKHTEISVTVKADDQNLKPVAMTLHPAYPNPFNPETNISFTLSSAAQSTSLEVYDINGRFVESLFNRPTEAGDYSVKWNGANTASGVYFIRLSSGHDIQIQRVTFLR